MRTLKGFAILTLALLFFAKAAQWAGLTDQSHYGWVFLAMSLIGIVYGAYTLNTEIAPDGTVRPLMTTTHIGWALGLTVMLIVGLWMTNVITDTYTWAQATIQGRATDAKSALKIKADNDVVLSRCLQSVDERREYAGELYNKAADREVALMRAGEITIPELNRRMAKMNKDFVPVHQGTVDGCDDLLAPPPTPTPTNTANVETTTPAVVATTTRTSSHTGIMEMNPLLLVVQGIFPNMNPVFQLALIMGLVVFALWMMGDVLKTAGKTGRVVFFVLWGLVAAAGWTLLKDDPFWSNGISVERTFKTPGQASAETAKTNWAVDVDALTAGAPSERDARVRVRKAKQAPVAAQNNCVDSRMLSLSHPWVKTSYLLEDQPLVIKLTNYTLAAAHSEPCGISGCAEQRTPGILPNPHVPHMLALASVGGTVIPLYDGVATLDPSKLGSGEILLSVHQVIKQEVGNLDADNEWRQMRGSYCYEVRLAAEN